MNNIIYIMACGPSINKITDNEWEYLENQETIGFSNFPFKNKPTKYHIATENFRDDKRAICRIKSNKFMNTKIYSHKPETVNLSRNLGFDSNIIYVRKGLNNFNGKMWIHGEAPNNNLLDNFGETLNDRLFTFRGQLSTVLNFAYTLNPKEIRLCGVDLTSQSHFFDDDSSLESLTKYQKKAVGIPKRLVGWNPEKIHTTACPSKNKFGVIVTVPEIIKQLKYELDKLDIGLYVCSKESLLYKEDILEYRSIINE